MGYAYERRYDSIARNRQETIEREDNGPQDVLMASLPQGFFAPVIEEPQPQQEQKAGDVTMTDTQPEDNRSPPYSVMGIHV